MDNNLNRIISIQAILKGRNEDFDNTPATAIKMVRHADTRVGRKTEKENSVKLLIEGEPVPNGISSLYEMYLDRRDLFDKYQSEQLKGRFDGIKYMIVFLGEKGTSARFLAVYEIKGQNPSTIKDEVVLELSYVPEFKFLKKR